jgi:hypothetical protein
VRNSVSLIFLLSAFAACTITTRPVNIGTKTALERQLMGQLEPLSDEQLLAASVRAPSRDPEQGGLDTTQAYAMAARRRQAFNKDEIDELKGQGCLGEAKDAMLAARPCDATADAVTRRDRLLAEENDDRKAIIDWVASSDESYSGQGRAQLVAMYHRLLLDNARPGDAIENDSGWTKR